MNEIENEIGSGTADPATPTAVSLPTRRVEAVEVVVVTATFEPGQETSFEIFQPGTLLEEEKVATTTHFDLYANDGYFPVPLVEWQALVETIYEDVMVQLGTNSAQRITLYFRQPSEHPCPARGLTMLAEPPEIIIFADDETSQEQLLGVMAHEIGHVFLVHGFDPPLSSNRTLNEGLATWASQQYWNAWHGWETLADGVQSFKESSTYLPLYDNVELRDVYRSNSQPSDECLERRDILYTEWAAFQDYLIQEYGMDKLIALYETTIPNVEETDTGEEVIVGAPPDYQAIYGQALNQLETAWLQSLVESK